MPSPDTYIAWISNGETFHHFTGSLASAFHRDGRPEKGGRKMLAGQIHQISSPRIAENRSVCVDEFLKLEDGEWLLMIDTDMVFELEDIYTLRDSADPVDRPIVGGLCFAGHPWATKIRPTIMTFTFDEEGNRRSVETVLDYPKNSIVECDATGAAFLLVHRSVFEAMSDPYPGGFGTRPDGTKNPYPWFVEGMTLADGVALGEDTAFCARARALGLPVCIHTGVEIGHVKPVILRAEQYRLDQAGKIKRRQG